MELHSDIFQTNSASITRGRRDEKQDSSLNLHPAVMFL